jgi:peptide/nickel transport system substrate-binding protein
MKIKLYLNSGNARRAYACNIVQENWKAIGVACELVEVESNTFFSEIMNRKYNHPVFAGTAVGLEIDPKDTWSSDFKKARFNWAGYQIPRLDTLMQLASNEPNPENAAKYWMEFQEILHEEQPRTFMYWVLQTHAFSKNILNSEVSVTTTYEKMYRWKMNAGGSVSTASFFTAE